MTLIDLNKRVGLVVGIANDHSLAWAAARHFHEAGAELALTYLNEKAKAFVEPLARQIDAALLMPCDVTKPGELEAVYAAIEQRWGRLDFLMHSIALWTVGQNGLRNQCSYPVTRSFAWRGLPSR